MQYQILIWSIQAYKTTSYNCVHSLAKTPLIADYIEAKNMKFDLNNLSFEDKQKYNIDIPFIIKSYIDERMLLLLNNTNETFTSFFNLGIPNYFRPNFHNTQFVTNHGNFGSFLERIRASEDPGCFCGCRIQDSTHLLLKCPAFQDYRLSNGILCTDPRELISSRDSYIEFNRFCKFISNNALQSNRNYKVMYYFEWITAQHCIKRCGLRVPRTHFQTDDFDISDKERPGRPTSVMADRNLAPTEELIKNNWTMMTYQIMGKLSLSKGSVLKLINNLGYRKLCSKWVPKLLIREIMQIQKEICLHLMKLFLENLFRCLKL
ncbi:hypothetical protein LAZ67_15001334 [Cordylochernes scorpioides]|uniref:Reverse transcriptase zinc-binding domain-containing protein n=1 Tax=Cordylochernes scorpioides TaxID=51811 RepID=A0ABY6L8R0_9ARAC|nr:hypothetical protein LAZ67_15001334 [Cordylochernes scorpioides]